MLYRKKPQNKGIFTLEETASYIGCSLSMLRNYRREDSFPKEVRLGIQKIYFKREELDEWLENRGKTK